MATREDILRGAAGAAIPRGAAGAAIPRGAADDAFVDVEAGTPRPLPPARAEVPLARGFVGAAIRGGGAADAVVDIEAGAPRPLPPARAEAPVARGFRMPTSVEDVKKGLGWLLTYSFNDLWQHLENIGNGIHRQEGYSKIAFFGVALAASIAVIWYVPAFSAAISTAFEAMTFGAIESGWLLPVVNSYLGALSLTSVAKLISDQLIRAAIGRIYGDPDYYMDSDDRSRLERDLGIDQESLIRLTQAIHSKIHATHGAEQERYVGIFKSYLEGNRAVLPELLKLLGELIDDQARFQADLALIDARRDGLAENLERALSVASRAAPMARATHSPVPDEARSLPAASPREELGEDIRRAVTSPIPRRARSASPGRRRPTSGSSSSADTVYSGIQESIRAGGGALAITAPRAAGLHTHQREAAHSSLDADTMLARAREQRARMHEGRARPVAIIAARSGVPDVTESAAGIARPARGGEAQTGLERDATAVAESQRRDRQARIEELETLRSRVVGSLTRRGTLDAEGSRAAVASAAQAQQQLRSSTLDPAALRSRPGMLTRRPLAVARRDGEAAAASVAVYVGTLPASPDEGSARDSVSPRSDHAVVEARSTRPGEAGHRDEDRAVGAAAPEDSAATSAETPARSTSLRF